MPCALLASLAASLPLLQTGGAEGSLAADSTPGYGAIDLSGEELPALPGEGSDAPWQSWLERISLWGYGAAAYADTGGTGAHPDGAFLVPDATLFLEALVTARSSFFLELLLERNNSIEYESVDIGELYLRFRDVLGEEGEDRLGVKAGRFDVPFGEDYLRFDSVDNPLITNSAAFPYAIDEGLLAHGELGGLGWITSVSNGSQDSSSSDGPAKSFALKLYGEPLEGLYLSASGLTTGEVHQSALLLSGYYLSAVGCYGPSTVGTSPSDTVKAHLWEADAALGGERWQLRGGFGQAFLDDEVSFFDRDISWFEVEPLFRITPQVYVAARYSAIGTSSDDEGYRFDGAFTGGGDELGYDTHRLWRVSLALGWTPNPNLTFKLEAGRDGFDLIDGSPFEAENDERTYFGGEIVLAF
jgi:hypothetical protein